MRQLTEKDIVQACQAFYTAHGRYPSHKSGDATAFLGFQMTWSAINASLRQGCRGLPGGTTLFKLKLKQGWILERGAIETLTPSQIVSACREFQRTYGTLPHTQSGKRGGFLPVSWRSAQKFLKRTQGLSLKQFQIKQGLRKTDHPPFRVAQSILDLNPKILAMVTQQKRHLLWMAMSEKQSEIAKTLRITQPSVCYQIQSTLKRCQGFNDLEVPTLTEVRKALTHLQEEDREISELMFIHGRQTAVAEILGRTQSYVRHRFLKALCKVTDVKVGMWLERNTVVQPQWSRIERSWFQFLPKRALKPSDLRRKAESILKGSSALPITPEQSWEYTT